MRKILIATVSLTIVSLAAVNGQIFTGTFSFNGTTGNTTSLSYNGSPINNLTISALTKNGVTNSSNAGNFRATNWALDSTPAGNLTGTIDAAKYFEFSLTASLGLSLNATSFTFGVGRSSTGPRSFEWRSSIDSFATPIAGYTQTNASLNESLGAGVLSYTADVTTGATGNTLSLPQSVFSNLSSVTYRFYAYNSETNAGSGGFEGNFSFSGEIVPEPSTWALIGLGATFIVLRFRKKRSAVEATRDSTC